eukprot:CAMPEP_0206017420 /NCGR_PEP_ID=MMETSP1464-20131121/24987_1 /ASSEMBLY_ACC=CAM_ASM_001124 /TAXON_ID=119497 /ORGANISM="Exanthemachrysis gayraliae, Strain RCC1523" /LENGTH=147 /DNA_ID=CAMNT_0053391267 /DNA_START=12 /DNA_END=452 /DNA_ORIENTATION=-
MGASLCCPSNHDDRGPETETTVLTRTRSKPPDARERAAAEARYDLRCGLVGLFDNRVLPEAAALEWETLRFDAPTAWSRAPFSPNLRQGVQWSPPPSPARVCSTAALALVNPRGEVVRSAASGCRTARVAAWNDVLTPWRRGICVEV